MVSLTARAEPQAQAASVPVLAGLEGLPGIAEPLRMKADLRRLAGEDPSAARAAIVRRLSRVLWQHWRPALLGRGGRAGLVRGQVTALGYETWLWVMGDRPWDQLASALAGRVERRLPGSVTTRS